MFYEIVDEVLVPNAGDRSLMRVNDGNIPKPTVMHDAERFPDRIGFMNSHWIGGHHVHDGVVEDALEADDLIENVSLGKNTAKLVIPLNQRAAGLIFLHPLQNIADRN